MKRKQVVGVILMCLMGMHSFLGSGSGSGAWAAAVNLVTGVAVSKTGTVWNNLKDAAAGSTLTSGVAAVQPYVADPNNSGTFIRVPGDATYGAYVQVKKTAPNGGTSFYACKRVDLDPNTSVNFPFGFTSKIVSVETDPNNTGDVVVDWLGGTAEIPGDNTAGDDLIPKGQLIILDYYEVTSISARAASGTQTLYVRAFK